MGSQQVGTPGGDESGAQRKVRARTNTVGFTDTWVVFEARGEKKGRSKSEPRAPADIWRYCRGGASTGAGAAPHVGRRGLGEACLGWQERCVWFRTRGHSAGSVSAEKSC